MEDRAMTDAERALLIAVAAKLAPTDEKLRALLMAMVAEDDSRQLQRQIGGAGPLRREGDVMTNRKQAMALLDQVITDLQRLRAELAYQPIPLPLQFDAAANAKLETIVRERLKEAIARGRMIAAAMD